MMERTDRHFRYLLRQITRHTLLYTEMIHTGAVLLGDRDRLLAYSPEERPLSLQLGGADPTALAASARIAQDLGYDEVNLNVGCPSDRVRSGHFGACLMAEPQLVADCVAAMRTVVTIPVTVKHRIGIDDLDSYELLVRFVDTVAAAGCDRFTVHARKAWLHGLSAKENRTIPPLRYDLVRQLKRDRPGLVVEINGGVLTLDQVEEQLPHVDAVMVGRAAYDDPMMLAEADARLFGSGEPPVTPMEAGRRMLPYLEALDATTDRTTHAVRHLLNLFKGTPGARMFRRTLSETSARGGKGASALRAALRVVEAG